MSSASFQIIFDEALDNSLHNHEINVTQLSVTLAALGALFESADNYLNEWGTERTLKVKGALKPVLLK